MPNIDSITPVNYDPNWPYNADYDNLPLNYILARQQLINLAVDQNTAILRDAVGTAGTLSNRLNQSINPNGSLIPGAIDQALHSAGAHTEGTFNGIAYCNYMESERDKLSNVATGATSLALQFDLDTISTSSVVVFDNQTVEFQNSDTVSFSLTAPNIIQANLAFPSSAAHQHNYDLIPVAYNLASPDYTNYIVTSMATPFIDGSLRIYINGIRISENVGVYVFKASSGPSGTWSLTSFTSDATSGFFTLNRAIDPSDAITIDFDIQLVS